MHQYLHHISDFRGGTVNMTRLERWIYRDLLEVYYDKEQPLTLNVADLCRDIGVRTDEERAVVEDLLGYKFSKTDEGYVHDVCERVIDEYKAKAGAARENGKKGGRPKKPEGNQGKTPGFSGEPNPNPEEPNLKLTNNRKPITNNQENQKTQRAPRFDAQSHLVSLSVDPQVADDWLKLRKGKRLASTETAFAGVQAEAQKAGLSLDAALRICCMRGWGGFDASWLVAKDSRQAPANPNRQEALEARNNEVARRWAERRGGAA